MIKHRFVLEKVVILLFLSMSPPVLSLTITVDNNWGAIFASSISPYSITMTGEANSRASVIWKLVSKGRTLSSGQQIIMLNRSKSVTANLPLQTPPLKPGINIDAQLIIDAVDDGGSEEHYEFKLRVFGPDIFLTEQEFYRQLDIQLFDPVGKTAEVFDSLKIPYDALSRSQLINLSRRGLVVVGAGVALDQTRGLSEVLIELARNGRKVLILQPVASAISLSEISADTRAGVPAISFSDALIVQHFAQSYRWLTDDLQKNQRIALPNYHST